MFPVRCLFKQRYFSISLHFYTVKKDKWFFCPQPNSPLFPAILAGNGKSQTFFTVYRILPKKALLVMMRLQAWISGPRTVLQEAILLWVLQLSQVSRFQLLEELYIFHDLVRHSLFKGCAPIPTGVWLASWEWGALKESRIPPPVSPLSTSWLTRLATT